MKWHDGAQRAVFQALLHPVTHLAVQRAVVQCDFTGPFGPGFEQKLVPDLGLRTHVGEDERGAGFGDLVDHRLLHARAQVAGPRILAGIGGNQCVDHKCLVDTALNEYGLWPDRAA